MLQAVLPQYLLSCRCLRFSNNWISFRFCIRMKEVKVIIWIRPILANPVKSVLRDITLLSHILSIFQTNRSIIYFPYDLKVNQWLTFIFLSKSNAPSHIYLLTTIGLCMVYFLYDWKVNHWHLFFLASQTHLTIFISNLYCGLFSLWLTVNHYHVVFLASQTHLTLLFIYLSILLYSLQCYRY